MRSINHQLIRHRFPCFKSIVTVCVSLASEGSRRNNWVALKSPLLLLILPLGGSSEASSILKKKKSKFLSPITGYSFKSRFEMGSLFRSEDMTLCQLFLQVESAYQSISELGELGLAQFRDLNPELNSFQRKFIGEVKRCDEIERRLRFLEKEIIKCNIPIFDKNTVENVPIPAAKELIPLELTFEKNENELLEVIKSQGELHKTLDELTELKFLLEKAQAFFDLVELTANPWSTDADQASTSTSNLGGGLSRRPTLGSVGDISVSTSSAPVGKRKKSIFGGGSRGIDFSRRFTQTASLQLCFVSGVIENTRLHTFERILWRVCRGNVFFRGCPIDVPLKSLDHNDEPVQKTVFFIFFQGEELRSRILKICEG